MSLLRALRPSLLLLVTPFLFAAHCKKKTDGTDSTVTETVTTPEVRLQVVSVEPSLVEPDTAFRAIVYGSAFQAGARVWFGATEIAAVTFRDENTLAMSVPPLPAGLHDVKVQNPNGEVAVLRMGMRVRNELPMNDPAAGLNCSLIRVPFDFDKYSVGDAADRELTKNLACFTSRTTPVRIEGHCDERGTTEYNLALGLRRAEAIQKWLINHNVPPSRLRTVSYGEERPIDNGHGEASWAKNRRADISVQ